MSSLVSLSELKLRVREVSDSDVDAGYEDQHHIDDEFLRRTLNRHLRALHRMLCESTPEYYAREATFASVASQRRYDLPTDFWQVLKLMATDGSGNFCELRRWDYDDLVGMRQLDQVSNATLGNYCYKLDSYGVTIRPTPTVATHTFYLDYLPAFAELVEDGDTFDGVNGFEDWAVYMAASDVALRQDDETLSDRQQQKAQRVEQSIRRLANRDDGEAVVIQDTRKDLDGYVDPRTWWAPE